MLAPNNVLLLVHDKKYQADPAMQKLSNETTSIASKMPLSAHRHVPPMDRSIINQTTENLFVQGPTSQTKYTSKSPMSNTGCKLKNSHQSRLHSSKSSLTISWQCRYLQFFFFGKSVTNGERKSRAGGTRIYVDSTYEEFVRHFSTTSPSEVSNERSSSSLQTRPQNGISLSEHASHD